MLKIFIFSNAIGTYSFLYAVEWLLETTIDTVITTDETLFEKISNSFNFKINYYKSIEHCVSNCDIIIIYNGKSLPQNTISIIKRLSTIQNKKCIEIDGCMHLKSREEMELDAIKGDNTKMPSIVIFSIGVATMPMKVEFDVNRIFSDMDVPLNHFLSSETTYIVSQFRDAGIESRVKLFNEFQQADVFVCFLDLENSIHNIRRYYDLLSVIQPDYIIVLTDYNLFDYDELNMYIKSFCARFPDVIVKSRWFSIGNNMLCHSDNFDNQLRGDNQFVLDFEDKDFFEKLKYDMLSKITLAEGIKRLR